MNDIQGLICLDLWQSGPDPDYFTEPYLEWLDRLPEYLKQFKFDSIINASYGTRIDFQDTSVYNTFVTYNWAKFDQDVMITMLQTCNNFTMSQKIIDQVFGLNTFALYDIESFIKHSSSIVPHVKNWLVVGGTWNKCVHWRRLGLSNLAKLHQYNFFGSTWGFYKNASGMTEDDFKNNNLKWNQVDREMFQLIHS